MTRWLSRLLPVVGVLLLVVSSAAIASAAVTTASETAYNGSQADTDQAIEVTYTVSPDGGTINNMTINFAGTSQTFVESTSFSFTVNPGGAGVDVESRPGDRFFIEELEEGEEVTFTFEMYPKTIKQEQIDAVSVRMEYIQNGQDLSESETVTADMTSSPWFSLQTARETVSQQESQLQQVSLVGQVTDAAFLGGIVLGIVGIAFGAYSWRQRSSKEAAMRRQHASDLESLAERMEKQSDRKLLNNEAESILENTGDGGREEGDGGDW